MRNFEIISQIADDSSSDQPACRPAFIGAFAARFLKWFYTRHTFLDAMA